MEDRRADAVELESVTGSCRVPGNAVGEQPVQEAGVSRVGHVGAGLDDQARREARHHGRQAAEVIGMGVGDHRERQGAGTLPLEKRRHHPSPRVRAFARGAGVHQDPVPGRRPDRRGVALPHVQKM